MTHTHHTQKPPTPTATAFKHPTCTSNVLAALPTPAFLLTPDLTIESTNDAARKVLIHLAKEARNEIEIDVYAPEGCALSSLVDRSKIPGHPNHLPCDVAWTIQGQPFQGTLSAIWGSDRSLDGYLFLWNTAATDSQTSFIKEAEAIRKSQAVIEFDMSGIIQTANDNFLQAMGYSLKEIVGQHHSMFVESHFKHSSEYISFWDELRSGIYQHKEYKRVAKGGRKVWIQASYHPITGDDKKPFKVVKYAIDVTEEKLKGDDLQRQMDAIHQSQAVIEFNTHGVIQTANENFLQATGYSLQEIAGQHHSIFMPVDEKNSPEYRQFWHSLAQGSYKSGEFRRISKSGKEIWIHASYNPIIGPCGRPVKVIKYATDVTQQANTIRRSKESIRSINNSTQQLLKASENIQSNATQTANQVRAINEKTSLVSQSMNQVKDGTEEMQSTIRQITGNTARASSIASSAATMAEDADHTMHELNQSSAEISKVIKVITAIAQQTNLLALNATIEAARAGESGKGFAVVANEVKELAKETAQATEDISNKIEAIQVHTRKSSEALGRIRKVINEVDVISSEIAHALEEQSHTTDEISHSVQRVSESTNEIMQSISEVSTVASETLQSSEETQVTIFSLSQSATDLGHLVSRFPY